MGKRRFGRIRKLPSGRWQARYPGPDGIDRPAPRTFPTKTDADIWLNGKDAEIRGGDWIDPDRGRVPLAEYASAWVEERPNLRPNTFQMYRYILARHLIPTFGNRAVADITEADVRRWRKNLLDQGAGTATVAKAYRLLGAILNTAVDDGLMRRTGNQLTANAGTGLRELMDRMGHSSTRAALIYLHRSDARQREIADSLGKLARAEMKDHRKGKAASGPRRRSDAPMFVKSFEVPSRAGW
jgi:Phage integrase, N-terminal SAM-like domain